MNKPDSSQKKCDTEMPPTMSKSEVAKWHNCSEATIMRMVKRNEIPQPISGGRLIRFSRKAILDWINETPSGTKGGDDE